MDSDYAWKWKASIQAFVYIQPLRPHHPTVTCCQKFTIRIATGDLGGSDASIVSVTVPIDLEYQEFVVTIKFQFEITQ